jgi:acetyltransferase-like isoleucine patch superfamily enzyme
MLVMVPQDVRLDALLYICNLIVANLPSARLRHIFYRNVMQIEMGSNVHIFSGLWLDCRRHLQIGENTVINQRCRLDSRGGLKIGANVSISPEVHVLTADHDIQAPDCAGRVLPVEIGDLVFVGSRALILPGVKIGRGAVIAAGAVVTRDVEEFSIVAGVPARPIGKRIRELNYTTKGKRHFI